MDEITVIIPAFNAEKTIERCVKSFSNQTFHNFKLVIVNDGSTDKTKNILYNLKKLYPKIIYRIINQKNMGVSNARNTGLRYVNTKYVTFCDADDFVEKNYLETLINPYKKFDNIGLSICGYKKELKNDKLIYQGKFSKIGIQNQEEIFNQIFTNKGIEGFTINKLYIFDLIKKNNIFFDEKIKIAEDLLFNVEYINLVDNIYVTEEPVYHYLVNNDSETNSSNIGKKFQFKSLSILDAYERITKLIPDNYKIARVNVKAQLANNASNILRIIYVAKENKKYKDIILKLKKIMLINLKYFNSTKIFTIKTKLKFVLNMISPRVTAILWNLMHN